jgi:hypothetical protein
MHAADNCQQRATLPLIRHDEVLNFVRAYSIPFGLSLSKPFDRLRVGGSCFNAPNQ